MALHQPPVEPAFDVTGVPPLRGFPPMPGDVHVGAGNYTCGACGARYRPSQRKRLHRGSPECTAYRVTRKQTERGWVAVDRGTARILRETGLPVETKPGGWGRVWDEKTKTLQLASVDVDFTPKRAMECVTLLRHVRVDSRLRRGLIRLLHDEPEFFEAAQAVARMVGGDKRAVSALRAFVLRQGEALGLCR